MIAAKNLSYAYTLANGKKITAVQDVSFELGSGEILGIIGKTGSGKSTLVSVLAGILKPLSGTVLLGGKDIFENASEMNFKIGIVFQYPEYQLFEDTVFNDIAFASRNKGLDEKETEKTVKEMALAFGIKEEILKSPPFDLSGGEKRKCAIAGVCAMKPEVLILDEPTAGLDFKSKKALFDSIKTYCKKSGQSVIFISHVMEEVIEISDKILMLKDGKTAYYGDKKGFFENFENIKDFTPEIFNIMKAVKSAGYNVSENILTISEAKNEILRLLKQSAVIK